VVAILVVAASARRNPLVSLLLAGATISEIIAGGTRPTT